jgi:hypothetical protein
MGAGEDVPWLIDTAATPEQSEGTASGGPVTRALRRTQRSDPHSDHHEHVEGTPSRQATKSLEWVVGHTRVPPPPGEKAGGVARLIQQECMSLVTLAEPAQASYALYGQPKTIQHGANDIPKDPSWSLTV